MMSGVQNVFCVRKCEAGFKMTQMKRLLDTLHSKPEGKLNLLPEEEKASKDNGRLT